MKVEILIQKDTDNPLWLVNTDLVSIPFTREPDAVAFASRLNARINANHSWPSEAAMQANMARSSIRNL